MNRIKQAYIVIIVGVIVLIMALLNLDLNNLSDGPFSGIVGSLLIILSMVVTIRTIKKREETKQ